MANLNVKIYQSIHEIAPEIWDRVAAGRGFQPAALPLRKPAWIRARAPTGPGVTRIKRILRERRLSSVCEEALCPNLGECFSHGTATFMVMGND